MDIFWEIEMLKELIKEEIYLTKEKEKYIEDVLKASLKWAIEAVNMDVCLEYMDFMDYSILMANNLKKTLKEINVDIANGKKQIRLLKDLLRLKELEVIRLSTLSKEDLHKIRTLFAKEGYALEIDEPIFQFTTDDVTINPTFNASLEELFFIIDYINAKNNYGNISIEDYLTRKRQKER